MNIPRRTYFVVLIGAFLWCGLLLLTPYLAASSWPFAELLYRAFHPICHQLPERSFHLFGEKLAVCSRCSSIYFAFLVGVLLYPFISPKLRHSNAPSRQHTTVSSRSILFAALLPMLVDVALDMLGIHESTFVTRTLTGVLFGIVIPFVVLPAAFEGVQQLVAQNKNHYSSSEGDSTNQSTIPSGVFDLGQTINEH